MRAPANFSRGGAWRVLAPALAALVLASCSCQPPPITTIDPGFSVSADTRALDFGRVETGQAVQRVVSLTTESRAAVHLTLTTAAPFSAPTTADLPGGGALDVPVSFTAGEGRSDGVLVLSANGVDVTVTLTGLGVRPRACAAELPCHTSTWSLETEACVDGLAPDETACDPGNQCLEKGRCRAGTCVGQSRSCDDFNACTADACALETGCVHVPVACPHPTDPCRVAACDSAKGCGDAPAPELSPCGPIDCVNARVCQKGACASIPTPDGFECSPEVLCLPMGTCQQHVCTRPDAGAWAASWSAELGYAVLPTEPALLEFSGNLYFTACGLPGAPDASLAPPGCGVVSYTGTGFERFAQPFPDGQPRALVHVSPRGVLLQADGGLELYSRLTGEGLLSLPGGVAATATSGAALVVLASEPDGGATLLTLARDGGRAEAPWPDGRALAMDEEDALVAVDAVAGTLRVQRPDGGVTRAQVDAPGAPTLAVARGAVLVGGAWLVTLDADGGAGPAVDLAVHDAGPFAPLPRHQLLANGTAVTLSSRCVGLPGCGPEGWQPWTRAVDCASGDTLWEAPLLTQGAATRVVESVLVEATPGAVMVAGVLAVDAGTLAAVEVMVQGLPPLTCPLPPRDQALLGATFSGSSAWFLAGLPDGGTALEAWPLTGVPLASHGWVSPEGLSGTRRPLR